MNPIQSRRLSEWNPQLWREWKTRLKWRNLTATAIASALGQLTLLNSFQESWIGKVEDQQGLYRSIFQTLFWWALFLLMVMGSYLLVKDIAREEKRGTLAFLRLTPEPSGNILLGKLLGVPILLYLAIALALPLHLGIAIAAGLSPFLVLSFYLLAICACGFAYSYALLYAVGSKANPWYVVVGAIFAYFLLLGFWQGWLVFYELHDRVLSALPTLVCFGSLTVLALCFWQAAVHRLRHGSGMPPKV